MGKRPVTNPSLFPAGLLGFEEGEGFLVGAAGQEVLEAGRQGAAVALVPVGDGLGDFAKRGEVGLGIAVAEIVVGDDFKTAAEEIGEHGGVVGEGFREAVGWGEGKGKRRKEKVGRAGVSRLLKLGRGRRGGVVPSLRHADWGD